MNKKSINAKALLLEVAKCYFIKDELTGEELKARCGYQLNNNHINDLLQNKILVPNSTRPRKYSLSVSAMHLINHIDSYVNLYSTCKVQKDKIIARRQATISDYKQEIKRLKDLLKNNNINF